MKRRRSDQQEGSTRWLIGVLALALALVSGGCDTHADDTHTDDAHEDDAHEDDAHEDDAHNTVTLTWDEVALGCAVMGEGEAAHVMCQHGHSLNLRSESLYSRWLYLKHRGIEPASDADLMMGAMSEHAGVGLPAPITPTLRARLGERVRLRVISYGPQFHTFHVHGHLWLDGDKLIDNHTLGPAEVHEADFYAGAGATSPEPRAGAGDWMYHCHVDVHSASGMWGLLRVLSPDSAEAPGPDGRFPWEVPAPIGEAGGEADVWVVAVEAPIVISREFLPATGELVGLERPARLYVPVADEAAWRATTAQSAQALVRAQKETIGPWVLSLRQGVKVRVHLKNWMDVPASLHPHGVVASVMDDGTMPESVAAPSGGEAMYTWTADTPGTWPLHDHARTIENLGRGLFAALVVHPPGDPVADRDYVVIMHDYDMDWVMGYPQPSGAGH